MSGDNGTRNTAMRTRWTTTAVRCAFVAGAVLAGAIVSAPASQAADVRTATAQSSMGTVTVTAGEAAFDGETARIPLKFTYEKTHPVDWTRTSITVSNMQASQVGSRASLGIQDPFFVIWPAGSAKTGTGVTELVISSGEYVPGQPVLIYGTAVFEDFVTADNKKEGIAFSPVLSVNVAQEATTLRDVGVVDNRITGRATVESTVGTTGADGYVVVRYKKPGAKKWIRVDNYDNCLGDTCQFVNARGEFDLMPSKRIPLGSQVQVTLKDCNWCTDATTTVRSHSSG